MESTNLLRCCSEQLHVPFRPESHPFPSEPPPPTSSLDHTQSLQDPVNHTNTNLQHDSHPLLQDHLFTSPLPHQKHRVATKDLLNSPKPRTNSARDRNQPPTMNPYHQGVVQEPQLQNPRIPLQTRITPSSKMNLLPLPRQIKTPLRNPPPRLP